MDRGLDFDIGSMEKGKSNGECTRCATTMSSHDLVNELMFCVLKDGSEIMMP